MKAFTIYALHDATVFPAAPKRASARGARQQPNASWTEERIARMKEMWAEGYSASQIAAELRGGVTRNAVLGKLHRLGAATTRPTKSRKSRIARTRAQRRHTRKMNELFLGKLSPLRKAHMTTEPIPGPDPADVARIASVDLEPHHCKWPVGDPMEAGAYNPLFCGMERIEGQPYCLAHCRRAYRLPEQPARTSANPPSPPTFASYEKEMA